jgi:RimJ/RimL family protein N-acetyltransferase
MPPPELETARLRMRGHRLDDFADCAALWGDPEVTRFIGGKPSTPEEAWARLLRYVGHWQLLDFGFWNVSEKASGRFVGEVGFANFHRVIEPPLGDAPEMGWVLAPWSHGKGYATEAVRAALAWGDVHFGDRATVCIIDRGNTASMRVAEKAGFQLVGDATYRGDTVHSYIRPSSRRTHDDDSR